MDLNGRQKMLDATFGAVCETTRCSEERRRTLEEVVNLSVELAREGQERTVFRFRLTENGNLVVGSVTSLQRPLRSGTKS